MTSDLLRGAADVVAGAADYLVNSRPADVKWKGDRDPASDVDLAIEEQVRERLSAIAPEFGFMGEESGQRGARDKTWVLDPLDGTVNFLHGLPLVGISLALVVDGSPVLGVISLPFLGELYTGEKGAGARLNGASIQASATTSLESAIVSIGDYATGDAATAKNRQRLAVTEALVPRVQRVRMLGSAAADLAWVASGRVDASIALANNSWDVSAGLVIAEEAGAVSSTADGRPHDRRAGSVLCATPGIHRDLVSLIASHAVSPLAGTSL